MEAVRGRFHVWYEGCVIQVRLLRSMYTQQKESSLQHTHMQGCRKGEGYGGASVLGPLFFGTLHKPGGRL